jgi:hypothetical protein
MESKQTAIEWIQDKLPSIFIDDDNGFYRKLFEQALAMEKEQIMDAHEQAYIKMNMSFRAADRAKDYYQETYKK